MLFPLLLALAGGPAPAQRVIVLGFDGADAKLVEKYMDEGALPNLSRLRESGTYSRLGTTNPAQSPVSWAALNAGANPGKTSLYDFVKRLNRTASGKPLPKPTPALALAEPIMVRAAAVLPIDPAKPGRYAVGAGAFLAALGFGLVRLFRGRARSGLALGLLLGAGGAMATSKVLEWIPEELPAASNPQKAAPFWAAAAAGGIPFAGLQVPMAFPPDPFPGVRLLCGLGVPDVHGTVGDWCIYTNDELESLEPAPVGISTETAGSLYKVALRGGRVDSLLPGPNNFWLVQRLDREIARLKARAAATKDPEGRFEIEDEIGRLEQAAKRAAEDRVTIPVAIVPDPASGAVDLFFDGKSQRLRPGEWSDFYRVKFPLNFLLRLSTLVRAKVLEWGKERGRIYVEPINFDPRDLPPQISISSPRSYAKELAASIGDYETLGWACATSPVKDSRIDDQTFLEDVEFILRARERMLDHELARRDWRCLYVVFSEPDRVQHMLFRHVDPANPLHDPAKASAKLRAFGREFRADEAIRETCREMDRLVGKALAACDEGTVLLVASDHGFSSFRKGVNLNNWLHENGYLAIQQGGGSGTVVQVQNLFNPSQIFGYVDWKGTRAYSLGLGKIYLNVKGRETNGVVEPQDAAKVAEEIARRLEAYRDPETGARVVRRCYAKEEIYKGPHVEGSADLILGFEEGYRVSWQSTLGGIDPPKSIDGKVAFGRVVLPNDQPWSGDHCSLDPSVVPGVLFSNRRFALPEGGPDVLHVAPTALALLGVPVPAEMDRAPLALR
ncbi:MAG TPA: alkaline phosphatase family protein [Planctomycetota bacterium]|jgi:predicted AlkP superfamily phosphohydrolase/phosphomutase|nr:alkaline phosphatase family protein [Planctomycetota bacterium]